MRAAARLQLEEVRRARPELAVVPVTVEATTGAPGPVLVDAARGADLLVLGHRGRGAVRSALLGSVGLHCALHASCPVTIVRAAKVSGPTPAVEAAYGRRWCAQDAVGKGAEPDCRPTTAVAGSVSWTVLRRQHRPVLIVPGEFRPSARSSATGLVIPAVRPRMPGANGPRPESVSGGTVVVDPAEIG
jgi:hypothetical protein